MPGYNHYPDCMCGWCYKEPSSYGSTSDTSRSNNYVSVTYHYYASKTNPSICDHCGQEIFFVHHNGGIACVESLGYPWPKHDCLGIYGTERNSAFKIDHIAQEPMPKEVHTVPENIWKLAIVSAIELHEEGSMTLTVKMVETGLESQRKFTYKASNKLMYELYYGKLVLVDKKYGVKLA